MNRSRRLARRLLWAVAIAAVAAALTAMGLDRGAFAGFQNQATDRLFPSARASPAIVVVGMDEASIGRYGAPPWPRSVHARLAQRLAEAEPAVVLWDVLFIVSSQNTADSPAQQAETQALADALTELKGRGIPTVLGVGGDLHRTPGSLLRRLDPVFEPVAPLAAAAAGRAHVRVDTADSDGVVRSVPLVVETEDGRLIPALSLAAVLAYRGAPLVPVVSPHGVQAGGRFVPTDHDTQLRLNFAQQLDGARDRRNLVSAIDVLDPNFDIRRLTGKIVLIGATAEAARDNFNVPMNKSGGMPGVFIHANAINTMLTASYLDVTGNAATVLWVAALALLVALAVLFLPLWLASILTVLLAGAYLVLVLARFDAGHLMNLVYPFGSMAITFVAALMVRYFTETRHRQRVSKLFAQYVPETVAQQLVEEGRVEQAAEGERLDVSLFFCDLRGFTALSATLTPQQVRAMLNEFYDLLTQIILDHRGTVLKFVGDEVFAVFGAPLPVDHHPQVALDCAMAIQRAAPVLSERLAAMGIPAVQFGIGMNSGEVVAAHVGGGRRRQYDIVGDTVNLGSRMCGQAGKGDIVMTIDVYHLLDDPPAAESMGFVALKGIEAPIELMRIHVDASTGPPTDGTSATAEPESAATMGA